MGPTQIRQVLLVFQISALTAQTFRAFVCCEIAIYYRNFRFLAIFSYPAFSSTQTLWMILPRNHKNLMQSKALIEVSRQQGIAVASFNIKKRDLRQFFARTT